MSRIRILDSRTADQIAAGEVVERPASVVKELVENALDAGARRIVIEVTGGGARTVIVRDDGEGMSPEDARLALLRHATSKIQSLEDLRSLATLGFRGEALPSIASVSRLDLVTRPQGAERAWRIAAAGGVVEREEPVGAPPGTTVTVRDLFYNTPARAAGLRSAAAETAACSQAAEALALAFPHVSFEFRSDGRVLWRTDGRGRLRDAAAALYGPEFARGCVEVARAAEGAAVEGLAARPELARASRALQMLIVNGHAVRHAGLRAAAEAAYRGLLPARRFPAFILHLRVDPAVVDVNVHPRKLEVRFADERRMTSLVHHAIAIALKSADLTPEWGAPPASGASGGSRPAATPWRGAAPPGNAAQSETAAAWSPLRPSAAPLSAERVAEALRLYEPAAAIPEGGRRLPPLRHAGAVLGTYLLAEGPDGLYIVDQHAAHEKIFYEQLLRDARAVAAQPLALPLVVPVPPARLALFEERRALWERFGVVAEPFGPDSLVVRAVPALLYGDPQEAVAQLVEELLEDEGAAGDPRAPALALASCKAAVKAGDRLSPAEAQALLDRLASLEEPFTCPHGRPTVWKIPSAELERRFGRRAGGGRGPAAAD
ncbi:MAG: DNA mismatch repair endonuclease MutL [Firmicutes bacterium]|nr:DNA mismatch repair endonuclease MutL [Bacillota bacterium]